MGTLRDKTGGVPYVLLLKPTLLWLCVFSSRLLCFVQHTPSLLTTLGSSQIIPSHRRDPQPRYPYRTGLHTIRLSLERPWLGKKRWILIEPLLLPLQGPTTRHGRLVPLPPQDTRPGTRRRRGVTLEGRPVPEVVRWPLVEGRLCVRGEESIPVVRGDPTRLRSEWSYKDIRPLGRRRSRPFSGVMSWKWVSLW